MSVQDCPQCRWVPVVDEAGHRRLEMRWVRPGTVTALAGRSRTTAGTRAA
ncbi:hypothetical protein [Modestobacter altitudinis]|nr:hypothetical protein [Modestobacter altitudinis]